MKNVLSFIFGVLLGGSILFWGPQNAHLANNDPTAIQNSIGSISQSEIPANTPCPYLNGMNDNATGGCPYWDGKMGRGTGSGKSACPYLNEMKDKTPGGCPYREGKIQKSRPALNRNAQEI